MGGALHEISFLSREMALTLFYAVGNIHGLEKNKKKVSTITIKHF
jgi:hypothetical protein